MMPQARRNARLATAALGASHLRGICRPPLLQGLVPLPTSSLSSTARLGFWRIAALAVVVLWFGIGGIAHFMSPEIFASTIPPFLPWAMPAVYITGALELLGAAGLLWRPSRRAAGWGLLALTVCVTPANVYMWLHPELFPQIPPAALLWRLPLQVVLLAVIAFGSRPPPAVSFSEHRA